MIATIKTLFKPKNNYYKDNYNANVVTSNSTSLKQDLFWSAANVFIVNQLGKNTLKVISMILFLCAVIIIVGVDSAILWNLEWFLKLHLYCYRYSYRPSCERAFREPALMDQSSLEEESHIHTNNQHLAQSL